MITITILQDHDRCSGISTVIGHSGYAEAGSDIICAGVSALVINTINSIETFHRGFCIILIQKRQSGLIDFQT